MTTFKQVRCLPRQRIFLFGNRLFLDYRSIRETTHSGSAMNRLLEPPVRSQLIPLALSCFRNFFSHIRVPSVAQILANRGLLPNEEA